MKALEGFSIKAAAVAHEIVMAALELLALCALMAALAVAAGVVGWQIYMARLF